MGINSLLVNMTFPRPKSSVNQVVGLNCSSDFKIFENSGPSAENFKSFSRSLEHFFLTVGQNNFGNKIPVPIAVQVT